MEFVGPRQRSLPRPEAWGLRECSEGFVRAHAGGLQRIGGRGADLGDERAGLQVVARLEHRCCFPRGLKRELADIERVIRVLQVPGSSF